MEAVKRSQGNSENDGAPWAELFGTAQLDLYDRVHQICSAAMEQFASASAVSSDGAWAARGDFEHASLPAAPLSAEDYAHFLLTDVLPGCTNVASPRCLGHMTGAIPWLFRPLSDILLVLNQNVVKHAASASFTALERQTIAMFHKLTFGQSGRIYRGRVQDPDKTFGIVTAGSTISNLTALWIARNLAVAKFAGADVERDGIPDSLGNGDRRRLVILGSGLMHYSIDKAASLVGLGSRNVIKVAVDSRLRMCPKALRRAVEEARAEDACVVAIVGTAGTTDAGSIDPLDDIADIAGEQGIHFHVDAAWGTPLLFSDEHRHRIDGIERADSVVLDGHKQLHLPSGATLLLLRDPGIGAAIHKEAAYMLQDDAPDLGKRSLEGSRAASALFLHAALHVVGAPTYGLLIDQCMRTARAMAAAIERRVDFELLCAPETNIVIYRYLPPPLRGADDQEIPSAAAAQRDWCNLTLQKAQAAAGRTFVSRTTIALPGGDGRHPAVALRAVLINPLTSQADCESVLDEQSDLGERIWRERWGIGADAAPGSAHDHAA